MQKQHEDLIRQRQNTVMTEIRRPVYTAPEPGYWFFIITSEAKKKIAMGFKTEGWSREREER